MIVCIRFFSQWLTLLCNKDEGSFVQTVDCFNKMCNYFLSSCLLFSEYIQESGFFLFCCWPGRVEFLLTYTRAIVNAACQISIRNQSAVCYSFSGSRRHFDVIWRSLSLPSANNTSSAINNLFLVYLVSGNRYNTFSSELKCLNYVIFVVESTVIHCGQIISRRARNK